MIRLVREGIFARFRFDDPVRDLQVLCPMNRGRPGARVMQVENDCERDVYNSDLGVSRRIDLQECELTAEFDGREVRVSSYTLG